MKPDETLYSRMAISSGQSVTAKEQSTLIVAARAHSSRSGIGKFYDRANAENPRKLQAVGGFGCFLAHAYSVIFKPGLERGRDF
jgi:hypothetical protein